MRFSTEEITLARQLGQDGLSWEPAAGHYVYDETGFCKQPSPFQERVYFILNYDYFMKAVGGVERFKEIMTWLPTWHDARELLRCSGVSDESVSEYLREHQSIEHRNELYSLYHMIAAALEPSPSAQRNGFEG